ncbi:DUF2019 domain-containing protein [Tardiphaga sp.]|uniref:DUF2019 domain-containing protein n=1 Tax=Tardiphaga sp. TaxID=1926292 RepID=UPI0025DF0D36|nr:DUF2019 domain-containing protein [Tardiphaga sp.]
MTTADLSSRSVPELVEQFRRLALAKGEASDNGQTAKFNRLYGKLDAVQQQLRSRPGDQRRALVELYDHANPQVRFDAAIATLGVVPDRARAALRMIIDRAEFPQAANARLTLDNLREGGFMPR